MLDSIYLMSTHSAVEEQLASLVNITNRHGIRIVVIPLKSQDPRSLLTKDNLALLLRQLLPITAHFSKHNPIAKVLEADLCRNPEVWTGTRTHREPGHNPIQTSNNYSWTH